MPAVLHPFPSDVGLIRPRHNGYQRWQPPKGAGKVRLLEIEGVDLQPCGGTHLNSTAEVGNVRVGKVEKKGRRNRRVSILLDQ